MDEIRAIDRTSVHKICSNQVILTLATAVKELIENSLDAKATKIQINVTEYGSEQIVVSDNGCGVNEAYFQALTLKHYTSKISDFSDLTDLNTFGFRGEALSSLCALSNLSIITRHKDSDFGTKLVFDSNGIIKTSSKAARQLGTTVILDQLFHPLPVRHKEFLKNLKREFSKLCNLLYAYALLAKCSFSFTNEISGKKRIVFETQGESLKANISAIFSTKQNNNLLAISLSGNQYNFEGFISSCQHGCGRGASDRQFVYVNSRPVDNNKITRLINDTYHQYNANQYPFVVLNVIIKCDSVDVNLTPDKRKILIESEQQLLEDLKTTLTKLFEPIPAVTTSIYPSSTSLHDFVQATKRASEFDNREKADKIPRIEQTCLKIEILEPPAISGTINYEKLKEESQKLEEITVVALKPNNIRDDVTLFRSASKNVTKSVGDYLIDKKTQLFEKVDKGLLEYDKEKRRVKNLDVDLNQIREKKDLKIVKDQKLKDIKFFSKIDPEKNVAAEKELKRELSKESFKRMSIIGQFNLGFVIVKLNQDLFIIDQHASDEKYNFETLQKETVIQSQKLVNPLQMGLSIEKEELFIQFADVVRRNGFNFELDLSQPYTKRIKITALPLSKNWSFGPDDLEELLFLLDGAPEPHLCRPSRVRDMFASRACRKSVMIGTALNFREMRTIIDHMAELEQPWNCPHGRPTIRHLINIEMLQLVE